MQTPQVSILMPVKNEALYLQAALDSLYRQTFSNWELIAVDDGSTDETPHILADAAAGDCRIRVVATSGGLVHALNTGLCECHAPLVARMDGDDICHPLRLQRQADILNHNPDITLVACSCKHFPRKGLKQGMLAYETWQNSLSSHSDIMLDLFVESPFVHPSVMMRRQSLLDIGGYHNCGWPEDYDLWLRFAASGARFARIPDALFFWRDHPERATRTMNEYSLNAFRACKCEHLLRGFLKGISEVSIAGAGIEGRAWRRILEERGIRVTSWLDVDPRKVGRLLHGAPVHPVSALPRISTRVVAAIGVRGARTEFRTIATDYGLVESQDYMCVS